MCGFNGEWAHFSFNKCPIYIYDGASVKFSTNSQETDNSVGEGAYWKSTVGKKEKFVQQRHLKFGAKGKDPEINWTHLEKASNEIKCCGRRREIQLGAVEKVGEWNYKS